MSLYKILTLTYPSLPFNQFSLPSGVLGVVPLTLAIGGTITLTMNQLMLSPEHSRQDRSLLGWVSQIAGGNTVIYNPINLANWHLTALQKTIIMLYDESYGSTLGPFTVPAIGLTPGNYFLNILNLVNESNEFCLVIETTGD